MYICVCKAVNESAIRQAVQDGVTHFRDLSIQTGCGTQCGSCIKMARGFLDQALAEAGICRSSVKLQVVS